MIRLVRNDYLRGGLLVALVLLGWFGEHVAARGEARLFPVIADRGHSRLLVSPGMACWRWEFVRRRAAAFAKIEMRLEIDGGRDHVEAEPLVLDDTGFRYFRAAKTSPPNADAVQSRDICIDTGRARLEPSARAVARITVYYLTWHGVWLVPHRLRPVEFVVPP